ncbi:MAG TPA: hypothetical protein PLN52_15180 [Opitutaceae bacterium]|nr:hypothetical protein [Opitutaceae bacterium]
MRRPRKRVVWILLGSALAGVLLLYLAGGLLVARATTAALPSLLGAVGGNEGSLRRVEFEETALRPWLSAEWGGIAVDALPSASRHFPHPAPVRIRVRQARARVVGLFPVTVDLEFDGIRVDAALSLDGPEDVPFGGDEFDVPLQKIDSGRLVLPAVELGSGVRAALRKERAIVASFLREGATPRRVELNARLHFKLNDVPMSVRLETVRAEGKSQLRLNRSDLDVLSHRYDRPLTEAERDLLAANPLKAPVLLRIKEYVERSSRRLAAADRAYNEDSTRHVLWSYWLTKTFGPEFAEKVTEAHEIGSDNTAQESARDRSNNQLGREWAEAQRTEGQVVHRVKTDPRVLR